MTQSKNENKSLVSDIIFLIGIVLIVALTVVLIVKIVHDKPYTDFSELEHISLSEYKTQSADEEYYVLFYASEKNDNYPLEPTFNELIKKTVLEYATNVKRNGGRKIYLVDVSKDENQTILKDGTEVTYIKELNISNEFYIPYLATLDIHEGEGAHIHSFANDPQTIISTLLK